MLTHLEAIAIGSYVFIDGGEIAMTINGSILNMQSKCVLLQHGTPWVWEQRRSLRSCSSHHLKA